MSKEHHSIYYWANLYAIGASFLSFLYGYQYGALAALLPTLQQRWLLSPFFLGLLVATLLILATVTSWFAANLVNRSSRKPMMFCVASLFTIACWMMSDFSQIALFWAGRALAGIAVGICSIVVPLYIAEISPPKIRGRLVSYNQLAITIGVLGGLSAGLLFQLCLEFCLFELATLFSLLSLAIVAILPETPGYLYKKGALERAEKVANHLMHQKTGSSLYLFTESDKEGFSLTWKELFQLAKRPLKAGITLNIVQQCVGINAIVFYGALIFEMQTRAYLTISPIAVMVIIGMLNVVATLFYLYLIDRIGRRALMLTGSLGMAASLFFLALFLSMTSSFLISLGIIGAIVFYIIFFATSFGPTAILITSEIFPIQMRGKAMSLCFFANWCSNALVALFFPLISDWMGAQTMFIIFALAALYAFIFVLRKVPETKGKTFEQIQANWKE